MLIPMHSHLPQATFFVTVLPLFFIQPLPTVSPTHFRFQWHQHHSVGPFSSVQQLPMFFSTRLCSKQHQQCSCLLGPFTSTIPSQQRPQTFPFGLVPNSLSIVLTY